MATEEHALPPMIANSFVRFTSIVHAFPIATQHTRLEILAQPTWIGQRQIGKGLFPLNIVPWSSDVVIPADHPFDGIAHQIYVDRSWQIESVIKRKIFVIVFYCIGKMMDLTW